MDLGRYRDASVSLQRAARLRPNHTEAQQHLGLACAAVEDAPCAVAALRAAGARWALAGLFGGCDVWSALGAVFLDLGLPGRAHASFLRALQVAGAFHTDYMASALDGYAAAAAGVSPADPTTTLLSNLDGRPVTSGADAMEKLVAQLTRPVRWDLCTETLRRLGTTAIVEFPPAGALTGIAKRELRGVATHAVKTPADLDGLASL